MNNGMHSFNPKFVQRYQKQPKIQVKQQEIHWNKPLIKLPQKSDPYADTFKPKQIIVSANSYVDESQKQRIKSEQFQILKTIQETLNKGSRSFHRVITYKDGYSYQGEYKESKDGIVLEGNGVLKYQDEIIYQGQFRNNQFHGDGICKQDNKLYNLLDWSRKDQKEIRGIFENGILIKEQPMFY